MRVFSGQVPWLLQRLTALFLIAALLVICVVIFLGLLPDYSSWKAFAKSGHGATIIFVSYLAICTHAWIGARDVLLDYVKPISLRLTLLVAISLLLTATAIRLLLILGAQLPV
ncbi:MAG TPA: succinate dehydrogenase, hydrophobic membrane anchor protein [Rhodocyclaceae bacterium]|nr:succinate dehydrogenase, hydrophobic membrane anchor protein [Rhodocyclaceae bacterium]